jgi:uncharacterized protein (TIGR00299 family) protein
MLAYFDCFSGISGDMTLGALIDLGVPLPWLKQSIAQLPLTDFDIRVGEVEYNGIRARRVEVQSSHDPPHRHYSDIRTLIEDSPLPEPAKRMGLAVFRRLAEAEAGVHGCLPEEVHFHEVGAVDAIVDVVGAALGFHYLGIAEAFSAPVPTGRGFVVCRHGRLPVPAPATAALLRGVPTLGTDIEYELTTPTGAAIVTTAAASFGPRPAMTVTAIGYGAGRRNLDPGPNLLRIMLGTRAPDQAMEGNEFESDQIIVAETNIDDMNPEFFGFVMDRLFEAGALDVVWIPVQMKKNRPGTLLQVLCAPERLSAIVRCLLTETTSLGVRYYQAGRYLLERDQVTIESSFGRIPVKRIRESRGGVRCVPEYEVCRRIALEKGLPLRTVYEIVSKEASGQEGRL